MDGSETTTTSTVTSSTDFEQAIERCVIEALDEAFDPNEGGSLRTRFVAKAKAKARLLSMMRDADVKLAEQIGEAAARVRLTRSLAAVAVATEEQRAHVIEQLAGGVPTDFRVEPTSTERGPALPIVPFAMTSEHAPELDPSHCDQCRGAVELTQAIASELHDAMLPALDIIARRLNAGELRMVPPAVIAMATADAAGRAAGHLVGRQVVRNELNGFTSIVMLGQARHALKAAFRRVLDLASPAAAKPVVDPRVN